jgi:hypothetical protein
MYIIPLILTWVSALCGFVGIIGFIPFVIIGIVYLSKQSNENDITKKNSLHKKGIFFLVLPWALIGGGLLLLVVEKLILSLLK